MSVPQDPLEDVAAQPVGHERRRHPRAALDCPVTIGLADGPHQARLRDVSRNGLCFFLERRIPEMTVLRMQLDLPARTRVGGPSRVEGSGVVVRCQAIGPHVEHFEIAVFLNDMTEEDRDRLDAYVAECE